MITATKTPDSTTELLNDSEPLSPDQFVELLKTVRSNARLRETYAEEIRQALSRGAGKDPAQAFKTAQVLYALCDFQEAFSVLEKASASTQTAYLKGKTLSRLKRYDEAIGCFEEADKKGHDSFDSTMCIVDCLRRKGDLEEAARKLKTASSGGEIRAEYHYQRGRLLDAQGLREEAMSEFDRAIQLDGNHTQALFHLAYACDLYSESDEAIELYERCLQSGWIHVSALLNLAVLYEEAGEFVWARRCVRRVLAAWPNHPRARLYMKDVDSSTTMYYDEEQEKRLDRRNQVLEIPISDFELSVRARNCLKKMNIRTLGDLLRVTEAELLAYKNFGETSLLEIKQILTQKGLRLGQLLEEHTLGGRRTGLEGQDDTLDDNGLLNTPIGDLELSIRARKALQRLNLQTIGDLARCTEAELLGCKNFGQMSLTEIKQKLKERGLALRSLDD